MAIRMPSIIAIENVAEKIIGGPGQMSEAPIEIYGEMQNLGTT